MTGIASDNTSYTYVLGDGYYDDPVVEYFNSSGNVGTSPYMQDMPALSSHYDIAYEGGDGDGDIWVACDAADSPIRSYDTDAQMVAWVSGGDLPSGAQIRGLTFDTNGYLWASDYNAQKIYQIDLTSGAAEGVSSTVGGMALSVSSNPFFGSVTLSLSGVEGTAELAVFDLAGRTVARERIGSGSSIAWNGEGVPSGTYLVRATTEDGVSATRLVTKL